MNNNVIYSINGPVVKVKDTVSFSMLEMVYVGNDSLMGEVISISKEFTTIKYMKLLLVLSQVNQLFQLVRQSVQR